MSVRIPAFALALALAASFAPASSMNVDFPAGSTLDATVQGEISSKTAQDGQRFTAVTASGSRIHGHVSDVERANVGRKAHLKLNVDSIGFTDGTSASLAAEVIGIAEGKQPNYLRAAGTALGGMIVGNIVGKSLGSKAGGLIGLAGGSLLAANTANDIVVPAGALLRVKLAAPLVSGH